MPQNDPSQRIGLLLGIHHDEDLSSFAIASNPDFYGPAELAKARAWYASQENGRYADRIEQLDRWSPKPAMKPTEIAANAISAFRENGEGLTLREHLIAAWAESGVGHYPGLEREVDAYIAALAACVIARLGTGDGCTP